MWLYLGEPRKENHIMAFPESLSWTFVGEEAEEFERKVAHKDKSSPLVTGSRHEMSKVHKVVVENARKRKANQSDR